MCIGVWLEAVGRYDLIVTAVFATPCENTDL